MNADSKERLKAIMEKYPKIRELIKTGDYDTLWKGLFDPNFNEILTGPGTAICWNPMYGCFFMTAFAESGINCKLKEIPDYFAANPITAKFLFDLRIPDGVEKIGDSAVNLQFQGWFVPISLRPVLRIMAAHVTVWSSCN